MSGWQKRESASNLVVLGDDKEQTRRTGGLLLAIEPDRRYPEKDNYRIITQKGEEILISGSANLARQISKGDLGKFVKLEFSGWERSPNGKYKVIDVSVFDGELSDVMKKWPRLAEVQASLRAAPAAKAGASTRPDKQPAQQQHDEFEDFPSALAEEDDDLPF